MISTVLHERICAWPGTEAQSDSVVGFADVTSHERKPGSGLKVGNEPWPETADSIELHIGQCGGGRELQPAKMIRQ